MGSAFNGKERILLLSTSTLHGGNYLEYAESVVRLHFQGVTELVFIPFARPSLLSHDAYTYRVTGFFGPLGISVRELHTFEDPETTLETAQAVFIGGGNTFVLLKTLRGLGLLEVLKKRIDDGLPYMGSSAGTNVAGLSIGTTNDMPVVWPDSLDAIGAVPFNLNPHYLDPDPNSKHMGETRETRILEFHGYNSQPVVGLREGSWIRIHNGKLELGGDQTARIFRKGMPPVEADLDTLAKLILSK